MTHDEFIAEYHKFSARVIKLAEKARGEGILAMEEEIDSGKYNQQDILEYGIRLVVDGTDAVTIRDILSNIVNQEKDKYAHLLMEIKKEAVLLIQSGGDPQFIAFTLDSLTYIKLAFDPNFS